MSYEIDSSGKRKRREKFYDREWEEVDPAYHSPYASGDAPYDFVDEYTRRHLAQDAIERRQMGMPEPQFAPARRIRRVMDDPYRQEPQDTFIQRLAYGDEWGIPPESQAILREMLAEPGEPLAKDSREFFESRMGEDFSDVRIHSDAKAAESAESLNAKAFTTGNDIVFNEGEYNPQSTEGQRLLAHELTHVVQQRGGETAKVQRQSDFVDTWNQSDVLITPEKAEQLLAGDFKIKDRVGEFLKIPLSIEDVDAQFDIMKDRGITFAENEMIDIATLIAKRYGLKFLARILSSGLTLYEIPDILDIVWVWSDTEIVRRIMLQDLLSRELNGFAYPETTIHRQEIVAAIRGDLQATKAAIQKKEAKIWRLKTDLADIGAAQLVTDSVGETDAVRRKQAQELESEEVALATLRTAKRNSENLLNAIKKLTQLEMSIARGAPSVEIDIELAQYIAARYEDTHENFLGEELLVEFELVKDLLRERNNVLWIMTMDQLATYGFAQAVRGSSNMEILVAHYREVRKRRRMR